MQKTKPLTAKSIETTPDSLILVVGRRRIHIPWERCSVRLVNATETQRLTAELSPGGYGIHWPLLDEYLSITGLVRSSA